jgi:hypothetical protein
MRIKFNTAILAEDKGYDGLTDYANYSYDKENLNRLDYWEGQSGFDRNSQIDPGLYDYICMVPTQSELQTWLREEHNMYVIVLPTISMYWTFHIINIGNENIETPPYNGVDAYDYSTYEEALEEGLVKALNLI